MADEHDEEIRELHAGLTRHLDERTAALLMKRVMALDDRDRVTRQDLADLGAAIMARFEQVDQRFEQVETELVRLAGRIEQLDGRIEQLDGRIEQLDGRIEQLDGRIEQLDGGIEQLDGRIEQVETELVRLAGRIGQVDGRIGQVDGRIDSRREFDDARFEMLAARVDNGFDRIQSDLRGQLLVAVTTQTRTLLLALLGSFAVYAAMTLSLVR